MTQSTPLDTPGWVHAFTGKVRDLYVPLSASDLAHADRVLMVASDRVSAFDYMLEPPIPGKGEILTSLTLWWLRQFPDIPNHLLSTDVPDALAGRAVIAKRLDMFPIECVVRGYLTGSGWKEYQQTRTVCGVRLPEGLQDGSRLPEPIFTPAYKAPHGQHDENITFERMVDIVGEKPAAALRDLSLRIFTRAETIAESRGLILADTKFEFGAEAGRIILADEVLTPDSSRYWDKAAWESGNRGQSFDKQIVRDWLSAHWDRHGEPPALPVDIVVKTAARYRELLQLLEGDDAQS